MKAWDVRPILFRYQLSYTTKQYVMCTIPPSLFLVTISIPERVYKAAGEETALMKVSCMSSLLFATWITRAIACMFVARAKDPELVWL